MAKKDEEKKDESNDQAEASKAAGEPQSIDSLSPSTHPTVTVEVAEEDAIVTDPVYGFSRKLFAGRSVPPGLSGLA